MVVVVLAVGASGEVKPRLPWVTFTGTIDGNLESRPILWSFHFKP